jgi:hypothetical protein
MGRACNNELGQANVIIFSQGAMTECGVCSNGSYPNGPLADHEQWAPDQSEFAQPIDLKAVGLGSLSLS